MRTSSRTAAVLVFEEVELLELSGIAHVLSIAGRHWNWRPFKLFLASAHGPIVTTRNQIRLEAHGSLDACTAPELLVLPGGYGARRLLEDARIVSWLAAVTAQATTVASIGYGSLLLAKAGLTKNERVAVAGDVLPLAQELDATTEWVTEPGVVRSGTKLLSTAVSAGSLDLGLEVVSRELGAKQAATLAAKLGWTWPAATPMAVQIELPAGKLFK